ncbi:hypothetical protein [Streptomyces mexicanus]|uniref:hypothetical protein n=1 Tax=Streptomyces mexicanus TaxID=178566 RepID=UPI003657ABAA
MRIVPQTSEPRRRPREAGHREGDAQRGEDEAAAQRVLADSGLQVVGEQQEEPGIVRGEGRHGQQPADHPPLDQKPHRHQRVDLPPLDQREQRRRGDRRGEAAHALDRGTADRLWEYARRRL